MASGTPELWSIDLDIDQGAAGQAEPGHWSLQGYTWDPVGLVATKKQAVAMPGQRLPVARCVSQDDGSGGDMDPCDHGMDLEPHEGAEDCPFLDPETLAAAPIYVPNSGNGKNPVCQVVGCGVSLDGMKGYFLRHRVCEEHSKSPVLMIGDSPSRLCQQCSKFHHVSAFEGIKRTCRVQLDRIRVNKRNRRNRKMNAAAAAVQAAMGGLDGPSENPAPPAVRIKRPADSSGSGDGSWADSCRKSRHVSRPNGARAAPSAGAGQRQAALRAAGLSVLEARAAAAAAAAAGGGCSNAGLGSLPDTEPLLLPESGGSDTGSREHARVSVGVSDAQAMRGQSGQSYSALPRSPAQAATATGTLGTGLSASGVTLQAPSPPSAFEPGACGTSAPQPGMLSMQANRYDSLTPTLPLSVDLCGAGTIAAAAAAAGLVSAMSSPESIGGAAAPLAQVTQHETLASMCAVAGVETGGGMTNGGQDGRDESSPWRSASVAAADQAAAAAAAQQQQQANSQQDGKAPAQPGGSAGSAPPQMGRVLHPLLQQHLMQQQAQHGAPQQAQHAWQGARQASSDFTLANTSLSEVMALDAAALGLAAPPGSLAAAGQPLQTLGSAASSGTGSASRHPAGAAAASAAAAAAALAAPPSSGHNAQASSKLIRMSLENDDNNDESGALLENLMDLLASQSAEPKSGNGPHLIQSWQTASGGGSGGNGLAVAVGAPAGMGMGGGVPIHVPGLPQVAPRAGSGTAAAFSNVGSHGSGNGSLTSAALANNMGNGPAAAAAASNGHLALLAANGLTAADLGATVALSRVGSEAVGSPPTAMIAAAAAAAGNGLNGLTGLESLVSGGPAGLLGGGAGMLGGAGLGAHNALLLGSNTGTMALSPSLHEQVLLQATAAAGAGGGAASDLLLQRQILIAQQQQQLQHLQQQQQIQAHQQQQAMLLQLQQAQMAAQAQAHAHAQAHAAAFMAGAAPPTVPAAGLLLSRLVDADQKTHHLSSELNGCLAEKQLLRRQLLATLSTTSAVPDCDQVAAAAMAAASSNHHHASTAAASALAARGSVNGLGALGGNPANALGLSTAGLTGPNLSAAAGLSAASLAGLALPLGAPKPMSRPSAATQLQALIDARNAGVAGAVPAMAAAAGPPLCGGGAVPTAAAGPYSHPPDVLTRVSLKIMNCLPDDLPHDIRSRMQLFASSAPLDLLQGCLRPGCTEVVLDALHASDESVLVAELLRGGDVEAAARALLAALPPDLRGKELYLQAADQALCLRPGMPPRRASWEGVSMRRGGVVAPKPVLGGVETLVVHADPEDMDDVVRLRVYGKHLTEPGVTFLARMGGLALSVTITRVGPVAVAAAAAAPAATPSQSGAAAVAAPAGAVSDSSAPSAPSVSASLVMSPSPSPPPVLDANHLAVASVSEPYDLYDVEVELPRTGGPLGRQGLLVLEPRAGVLLGPWSAVLVLEDAAAAAEAQALVRNLEYETARQLAVNLGLFVDHGERCAAYLDAQEEAELAEGADEVEIWEADEHGTDGPAAKTRAENEIDRMCSSSSDNAASGCGEAGMAVGVSRVVAAVAAVGVGAAARARSEGAGSAMLEGSETDEVDEARGAWSHMGPARAQPDWAAVFGGAHDRVVALGRSLLATCALRGCPALMAYIGSQLVEMGEPLASLPSAATPGPAGASLLPCALLSGCGKTLAIAAEWAARSGATVDWRAQVPGQPAGATLLHVAASLPLPHAAAALETMWSLALSASARQTQAAAAAAPPTSIPRGDADAFASAWFADGGADGVSMDAASVLFHAVIGAAAASGTPAGGAAALSAAAAAVEQLDRLCMQRLAASYIRTHNFNSPLDHVDLPSMEANSCSAGGGAGSSRGASKPGSQRGGVFGMDEDQAEAEQDADVMVQFRQQCKSYRTVTVAAAAAAVAGGGSTAGAANGNTDEAAAALMALTEARMPGDGDAEMDAASLPQDLDVRVSGGSTHRSRAARPIAGGAAAAAASMMYAQHVPPTGSPPRIRIAVAPKALAQSAAVAAAANASWLTSGSGADASLIPPSGSIAATTVTHSAFPAFGSGSMPAFGGSAMAAAVMAGLYGSGSYGPISGAALAAPVKGPMPAAPLLNMARPLPGSPSSGPTDHPSGTTERNAWSNSRGSASGLLPAPISGAAAAADLGGDANQAAAVPLPAAVAAAEPSMPALEHRASWSGAPGASIDVDILAAAAAADAMAASRLRTSASGRVTVVDKSWHAGTAASSAMGQSRRGFWRQRTHHEGLMVEAVEKLALEAEADAEDDGRRGQMKGLAKMFKRLFKKTGGGGGGSGSGVAAPGEMQ
ncbi:hypothetical protein HYH03_006882 [Edaphochlamys debaryana]|uniref:SBP-type domain-containing protein n=1 Tax=Edaphochlamys debaryana TaxID=47281 RepID=A0A835Y4C0_9CHLO|nr:hypothetical protein HYH03_006882 [Edaphochlamys debaryana]|eukprot:KAG2494947.1 hypothetical protein HYH03_006882 [Edaphochlamys debaryana]